MKFTFISVDEIPNPNRKTKRWKVLSKEKQIIGGIQWRSGWRCYVFEPAFPTVFEQVCLREIASFIESQTKEQKAQPTNAI